MIKLWIFIVFITLSTLYHSDSYQIGERISAQVKAKHDKLITSFQDISIDAMPRFRVSESKVIQVKQIPKLNPQQDLKFTLSFSGDKILTPWTVLYDSVGRRTLNKLVITFEHDEFDVLRLKSELKYGESIHRLDPSHPSLTAFEVEYRWSGSFGQDITLGIYALFALGLIYFCVLTYWVRATYKREEVSVGRSHSSSNKHN